MQENIHPKYEVVKVSCACGNVFETRSTIGRPELKLDVCNACHPFFTGKHKMLDTEGRVDKFMRRYARKSTTAKADEKKDK